MKKATAFGYIDVKTQGRTNPKSSPAVFVNSADIAGRNGKSIERIGPEYLTMITVVTVQTIFGGYPDKTIAALQNVEHHALRQPVVDGNRSSNACRLLGIQATGEEQEQEKYLSHLQYVLGRLQFTCFSGQRLMNRLNQGGLFSTIVVHP